MKKTLSLAALAASAIALSVALFSADHRADARASAASPAASAPARRQPWQEQGFRDDEGLWAIERSPDCN
jgi:hypothetical protein